MTVLPETPYNVRARTDFLGMGSLGPGSFERDDFRSASAHIAEAILNLALRYWRTSTSLYWAGDLLAEIKDHKQKLMDQDLECCFNTAEGRSPFCDPLIHPLTIAMSSSHWKTTSAAPVSFWR